MKYAGVFPALVDSIKLSIIISGNFFLFFIFSFVVSMYANEVETKEKNYLR